LATIAHVGTERRPAAGAAAPESAERSERSTAWIRIAVTVAVIGIYASSLGVQRSLGPSAVVILASAMVYGVGTLFALARNPSPSYGARVATVIVDVILVTWWVQATGSVHSEFWTLYLIVMLAAAMRFRLVETVIVAVGVTVMFLAASVVAVDHLASGDLILRATVMVATAFALCVIARQRAEHRRERTDLRALADSRERELGDERAEVERLRRADVKRSEFVAIAAHEFRSPLAAILGVLGTLKVHGDVLERKVRDELLDGASAQAQRLARLVEDLLTISRIEDGELRLRMESVDPRSLLAEAEQASGTIGLVQVELHRCRDVRCDADAIVRVLTNLLDNARKYSPEGSRIVVSLSQHGDRVRFAVRDHGAGIPPDDREAIFERFRRLGDRRTQGSGLGLYISRGLVEAHGGTLTVGQAPEGGAEFAFDLPAESRSKRASVTEVTVGATGSD
jgi:signal transduction histidine kinase